MHEFYRQPVAELAGRHLRKKKTLSGRQIHTERSANQRGIWVKTSPRLSETGQGSWWRIGPPGPLLFRSGGAFAAILLSAV